MARHNRRRSSSKRGARGQQGGAGVAENAVKIFGPDANTQFANLKGDSNVIQPMKGGARKRLNRSNRKKSQKGGYWAQVISGAVVPLSLFALNQHFANKSKRHSKRDNAHNNTKKRR
jgi:hypothetical protein